jgi:hypothetical protein
VEDDNVVQVLAEVRDRLDDLRWSSSRSEMTMTIARRLMGYREQVHDIRARRALGGL